ncbi:MAG: malate dehydrogenase [Actinobacteria bacterium]|nr:MAG: malate dehydrogenase [Actinomycetota bacterium]
MFNADLEKVSVIGTGNVGSTCAFLLAVNSLANIMLFDKFENIAEAKALDIGQSSVATDSSSIVSVGKSMVDLKDSKVVVITAGISRKPGMSRQDLIKTNGAIAKELAADIKENAPQAIVIVVSNPLDLLTWIVLKETGFERRKVFGMAGVVDNSRFKFFTAKKAGKSARKIKSHVLGMHSDEMVIPTEHIFVDDEAASVALSESEIKELKESTKNGGAQIVKLLGNGSAYYMPGTGAYLMCKSIIEDSRAVFDTCVNLDGEYGLKDVCLGVPVKIGDKGIEEIIELDLSPDSDNKLKENAKLFSEQLKLL